MHGLGTQEALLAALEQPARLDAVRRAERAVEGETGLLGLTEAASRLLGVDFAFLSLLRSDRELLVARVRRSGFAPMPATLPVEESVCLQLLRTEGALLVDDLQRHPRLRDLVEVREVGLRSYAGTPVHGPGGELLGGFCVGDVVPRRWSEQDAALLDALASAAAAELRLRVTLDDLREVQAAERRRASEQAALHRVAAAVARGEAPQAVLQQVAEELAALLDVQAAVVLRFLPDGRAEQVACAGPERPELTACANALAAVRGSGTPCAGHNGDLPCAAVPVHLDGRVWGAVVVLTSADGPASLLRQLEQLADLARLVIVNAEARLQLVELTRTDPLTGAANRRAFDERLGQELDRARRHGTSLTLALLDVDRFKQVNDRHGHDAGDRVLRELTGRVGSQLRGGDLLARIGGDEFALLFPDTDQASSAAVLERIRAQVSAVPLAGLPVTCTIGAAVVQAGHLSADALYKHADESLYAAKTEGRNTARLVRAD